MNFYKSSCHIGNSSILPGATDTSIKNADGKDTGHIAIKIEDDGLVNVKLKDQTLVNNIMHKLWKKSGQTEGGYLARIDFGQIGSVWGRFLIVFPSKNGDL